MVRNGDEEEILERDVAGQYNTFRVYIHMMKVKRATARNVFRALNMSSPSLAILHLEKLLTIGLIEKNYGSYQIVSRRRIGLLKFFFLVGRWFVPRTFFYSIFFFSMMIIFLLFSYENQSLFIPAFVALLSALINFYEALSFYRMLP